ncbi:hypothetical protein BHYA_0020g00670 [Botrytis hyacinthi]|uniref:Uncharacterized protein n=1 Tax=Botrytis hyacinthi TaxID=278943 RepID=A0A4Z1H963_9HELO|nr:hypothetical protein BHYA_0020g00670 [Botrytis hyacinthi]
MESSPTSMLSGLFLPKSKNLNSARSFNSPILVDANGPRDSGQQEKQRCHSPILMPLSHEYARGTTTKGAVQAKHPLRSGTRPTQQPT